MEDPKNTTAPRLDAAHIGKILRAEAEAAREPVVETAADLVEVTIDGNLRVLAIEFLDESLDPSRRAALQQATADAINNALRKAVLAKSEALKKVEKQLDWRELIRSGGRE